MLELYTEKILMTRKNRNILRHSMYNKRKRNCAKSTVEGGVERK